MLMQCMAERNSFLHQLNGRVKKFLPIHLAILGVRLIKPGHGTWHAYGKQSAVINTWDQRTIRVEVHSLMCSQWSLFTKIEGRHLTIGGAVNNKASPTNISS